MSMYSDDILDLTVRQAIAQGYHLVKTSKLNEHTVRELRKRLGEGYSQKAVAEMFGVTVGTVSHIATGKRWAHVV